MASLLDRKLIVVTGKGGTGKSTIACALGLLGSQRGLRTIVVELGDQHHIPGLFALGDDHDHDGRPVELQANLWSMSIDLDRAMMDWLQTLTGRLSARLLASSNTFHYFAAAAPGARELVTMMEVYGLGERRGMHKDSGDNDLVVLDAPATGHALAMLRSPRTFATIVRAGPLAEQARAVQELLSDPQRSAYVAVTHATEMAVTETLELEEGLRRGLDRDLDAVIVNGTVPRRFTREELARISTATERDPLAHSAGHMARAVYGRARLQQSQIARLRRQRFADGMSPHVATIPFAFTQALGLAEVRQIAQRLDRSLSR